ncbi:chemotaxis protein CheY [Pseudomonas aeruginosa]|uniref:two-component system response regulator HsbR n=1 Tax=Pseudomonas aeruginosa TaxID=287 RepID=UPI0007073B0F|nr:two-component system response regulator HsbR [Pseudomonas aeruginosa]KQJ62010.1 chemotaxis protein CheY [Pseudomonas aeruginosa]
MNPPAARIESLTILIAEDNAADRLLLSTIVSRQGHRVLTAGNGLEAVALFETERPQLVLMDVMMPVMDGFEAARRIKQQAGEELVPIIFLTSLSETEALVQSLEAGGDDFLSKPYNRVILEAKINAMGRLHLLQRTVLEQRDLIVRHNEHLLNEQRVAKAVFDKVAHSGCLNASNVRYLQSPLALFNGDLLLAAYKPSGGMHVLLGDFTGHGLPAAIGAMPLAEVFYGMTAKGYPMADILREMNAKLKRILPVGVFCCATLLNLSFQRELVEVWNGGLPDGYLLRAASGERVALVSRHLPLGILEPAAFSDRCETYPLDIEDRIFLFSDGVLEASNKAGEMFGEARLLQLFERNRQPSALFDEIQRSLAQFRGAVQDDVSMLEVRLQPDSGLQCPPLAFSDSGVSSPLDWSVSFEFRAETLKHFNPLPHVLQLLLEVHDLRARGGALYTVLAELYSNALEHGVIGLDSTMKSDAAGFARYYQERVSRLQALRDGYVRLHLDLAPHGAGGRLLVRVEDSGEGFDVERALNAVERQERLCGRGLRLIRELSDRCQWSADGKVVSVEFFWSPQV